jgi:hypothetical protein
VAQHTAAHRLTSRSLVVLVLVGFNVAIWLPRLSGPLDLRWDGGVYYVLGTALAQGKGYRLLNEPGNIEAIQYPPLLPSVVALHQLILRTDDPPVVGRWLRLSFFVISCAYVAASYAMAARFLSCLYAFCAALLCLCSLWTVFLSDLLAAELPFGLVSVLFVICLQSKSRHLRSPVAGLCVILAFLLRTAGVALLVAWIGESLSQRHFRRALLRSLMAALPVLAWYIYIAHVQGSPAYTAPAYPYQRADYLFYNVSYASNLSLQNPLEPERGHASLRDLCARVLRNAASIPPSLGEAVSTGIGFWQQQVLRALFSMSEGAARRLATGIVFVLGGLLLGGIALELMRRQSPIPLYAVAYIAAVCITPWPLQWPRYWAPLAPFLFVLLMQALLGLRALSSRGVPSPVKTGLILFPPVIVSALVIVQVLTLYHVYRHVRGEAILHDSHGEPVRVTLFYYDAGYAELERALEWLRARVEPADVIATSMPQWAYLITRAMTVMPPFEPDPGVAQALLDSVPVRYVVMDRTPVDISLIMQRVTLPLLQRAPPRWTPVYGGPSGLVTIYRRTSDPAPATEPASDSPGRDRSAPRR